MRKSSLDTVSLLLVAVLCSLLFSASVHAQGAPPFALAFPGSTSQQVEINPSVKQTGTATIEIFPIEDGGLQTRSQTGSYARHGRLWTLPGSTAFVINVGTPGEQTSAPLPNGSDSRSFLVFEDPIAASGTGTQFLFAGEHFYDASCPSPTCGYLAGGLMSEAESTFNLVNGNVSATSATDTPNYGRQYFNNGPFIDYTYNHWVESLASASIQDWVFVTGPGSTATVVVNATLAASIDVPPVPSSTASWTTPVYGDIRTVPGCLGGTGITSKLLRPEGDLTTRFDVSLGISGSFQQLPGGWSPSISAANNLGVERKSAIVWVDEEGFPDCTDDVATVVASSIGTPASTLSTQLVVPTNQWALVSVSSATRANCTGPFACDLDVSAPVHVTVSSPDGSLVAWQGIAGLTPVPEAENALAVALGALAWMTRLRRRA